MSADAERAGDVLDRHVEACDDCRKDRPPVEALREVLCAATPDVDAAALSRRTIEWLRPELARRAAAAFWRHVAAGLVLALLPLPAILAYDAFLLRAIHAVLSALLPAALASYLVGGMVLSALLLTATTYAAIPLLVHRQIATSHVAPA